VLNRLPRIEGNLISEVDELQPDTPLSLRSIFENPCESNFQLQTENIWTYQDLFARSGFPFYAPFFIDLGDALVIENEVEEGREYQRATLNLLKAQLFTFIEGLRMLATPVSQSRPGIRYTVQTFDTLPILSQNFYNTPDRWEEIAEANQLEYPYNLYPGQILIIPYE